MVTLMDGLEDAFGYFGGVPYELLFDQMKTVITRDLRLGGHAHPQSRVSAVLALFVWMETQKLGDIPSRLLSPWCAVPAIIGCAELVSADQLRRRGKAQRQAQGSTT